MRRRFFIDRFDTGTATLRGDSAHHLARVLRATPGQLYELSDGSSLWLARIDRVSKSAIDFSLVEPLPVTPDRLHLTLLLSIVKFDRFEWALEKATELGVAEIVPLAASRSEKALVAAAGKRAARWLKILFESAQQSHRLRPPILHPSSRPSDAFSSVGARHVSRAKPRDGVPASIPSVNLLLSERPPAPSLRSVLEGKRATSASLAIGPEGGWTDDEISSALSAGFLETSLGPTILRTETAVIAALASLRFALAD